MKHDSPRLFTRSRRANISAADVKVLRKLIREIAYIWLATLHLADDATNKTVN